MSNSSNKRFMERSVYLNNENEISYPMIIIILMGVVYVFGANVITDIFTTKMINYILFFGTAYMVYYFIQRGIVKSMRDIVVFAIVFPTAIAFANNIPTYLDKYADSLVWQAEIIEINHEYTGKVDLSSLIDNTEKPAPQQQTVIYATQSAEVTEVSETTEVQVQPTPQPTVNPLPAKQRETQVLLDRELYTRAYANAAETYDLFTDEFSFEVMATIQQALDKRQLRVDRLPIATRSSVSFMAGGEEERVKTLLAGSRYTVVAFSGDFGWAGCQKNVVIEETSGYTKGSQYEVKLCTLEQFTDIKVGAQFEVK